MKKLLSVVLCVAMITVCFVGCGKDQDTADTGADTTVDKAEDTEAAEADTTADAEEEQEAVQPIVMKFGHAHPAGSPRDESILYFKDLVEERTNGKVKVEVYPAGQLGKEPEMIEATKMGTLEACRAGCFDSVTTELLIYTMPFLFETAEDFQAICRGPIADKIAESSKEVGITITATGDAGGFRQLTNNVRPITSPEDMEGLKMRTPPVESIIKTMEALGANPVSVPYVETYMGLKTGVADGEENPIINIGTMKFYEVQKYMTMANYQVHPDPVYVSTKWLDSLPEDIRDIIVECSKEMMVYSDSLIEDAEAEYAEVMANSMEITELTDEQRQVFIDASKPVYDYFISEGLINEDNLKAVQDEIAK